MRQKIENCLNIFENLKFDVWFDDEIGCGAITIHHRCVSATVLDMLNKVVDLVAISCPSPDIYRVTFMTK